MSVARSCARAALRFAALVSAITAANAQEGGSVDWDPCESGPSFTPTSAFVWIALAIAASGLWRLVLWSLTRWHSRLPWPALRYWVPTISLVWGVANILLEKTPWSFPLEISLSLFVLTNAPVVLIVGLPFGALRDFPDWIVWPSVGVAWWFTWHWIIRLLDSHSSRVRFVSLRIDENTSR